MKRVLLPIIVLILLISLLPDAYAGKQSIGISYAQATQYLANAITLKRSSSVNGQTRYMGTTDDKMAIMEIIGERKNISQASLVIGLPKNLCKKASDRPPAPNSGGAGIGATGQRSSLVPPKLGARGSIRDFLHRF